MNWNIEKICFGVQLEEARSGSRVLGEMGQEQLGSNGLMNSPFAVMSQKRSLYDYFATKFAQVQPIRLSIRYVENMSLCRRNLYGEERNLFDEGEDHAREWLLDSPVLTENCLIKWLNFEVRTSRILNLTVSH